MNNMIENLTKEQTKIIIELYNTKERIGNVKISILFSRKKEIKKELNREKDANVIIELEKYLKDNKN